MKNCRTGGFYNYVSKNRQKYKQVDKFFDKIQLRR